RSLVVDKITIGQAMDDGGGHALGGREADGDRVSLPGLRPAAVGEPGPHVHHGLAVPADCQGATTSTARVEQLAEIRHHGCKHRMCVAVDGSEWNLSVRHPTSLPGGGRFRHPTAERSTRQPGAIPLSCSVAPILPDPGCPRWYTTSL